MKFGFVYAGGREVRLESARLGRVPTDFFYGALELERAGHTISVHDLNPTPSLLTDLLQRGLNGRLPPKTRVRDIAAARRLLHSITDCDVVIATSSGVAFSLGFWKRLGVLKSDLLGIHCGIVNCQHSPRPRSAASWIFPTMKTGLFAGNEAAEMRRQFGVSESWPLWFGVVIGRLENSGGLVRECWRSGMTDDGITKLWWLLQPCCRTSSLRLSRELLWATIFRPMSGMFRVTGRQRQSPTKLFASYIDLQPVWQ